MEKAVDVLDEGEFSRPRTALLMIAAFPLAVTQKMLRIWSVFDNRPFDLALL